MKKNAFTLIEILSVFTIIAIIAVIGFVQLGNTKQESLIKVEKLANANIIKVMEDYIVTNKVTLVNQVPLYFSVNSLIEEGYVEKKVNESLQKSLNDDTEGPYFISVYKIGEKIEYKVLNKASLESKIGESKGIASIVNKLDNGNLEYTNSIAVNHNDSKTIYFTFKASNASLYDVIIKSIEFKVIDSVTQEETVKVIKDVKKDKNSGLYYFNFKNTFAPKSYNLKVDIVTELSTQAGTIEGTFISIDPNIGAIITNSSVSSVGWGNLANPVITVTASGINSITNQPADTVKYSYVKYSDIAKTTQVASVSPTNLALTNGVGNISFNTNGIYVVTLQSYLNGVPGTITSHTVKIDTTPPNSCNITLRKDSTSGTVINPKTWVDASVYPTANGSDLFSGLARTEIIFTGATTNRTNCTDADILACTGGISASGISYAQPVCYDAAGNSFTGSQADVYIDKIDPTVTLTKCSNHAGGENDVTAIGWARAVISDVSPFTVVPRYKYSNSDVVYPAKVYRDIYTYANSVNFTLSTVPSSISPQYLQFQGYNGSYKVRVCFKATDSVGKVTDVCSDPNGDGYWDWSPSVSDHGITC